jgi:hypothetical protein
MKEIKEIFTNLILLTLLMYGCIRFTPFIKISKSYYNKCVKIYILRREFEIISTKLDSLEYHQLAGTGSPGSAVFIHSKINNKYFELHENPDDLVSEIENNSYSIQKVWYNRNYKKVFLKTDNQDKFPWVTILVKNIIAIIISIVTPLIIAFYLIKNAIKLIFLIYKKEYYNVENTEDI